jgi:SAM-dependent methyltransferase
MKSLAEQWNHGGLALGDHDARAAQDFAFTLRNHVTGSLMPANKLVFDRRAGPAHAKREGRAPQSPREVRAAMDADSWYRFYLSARRTSQELIWSGIVPVAEALPTVDEGPSAVGGTLTLEPGLVPPRYVTAVDIHTMPGGYCHDRGPGDAGIGALYDRGVYLYLSGLAGPMNDGAGQLGAAWLRARHPDFAPARILDLGCGVGHGTLAFADSYPDAEVHGLDAGAAMLRYAHDRAGKLGRRVHWRQGNAEATGLAAGSFDLVVSVILLHETSHRGLPAIMRECHRLLRPGGLMVHVDQPRFDDADAYATFLQENETFYNNEPFWRQFRRTDLTQAAVDAGFAAEAIESDVLTNDVVRQNQNNERVADGSAAAKKRGFALLCARKG